MKDRYIDRCQSTKIFLKSNENENEKRENNILFWYFLIEYKQTNRVSKQMHKILILSKESLKEHRSFPQRQIVSYTKNKSHVLYSSQHSNLKMSQEQLLQQQKSKQKNNTNFHQDYTGKASEVKAMNTTEILGELKLFHQYQSQKIDPSNNQSNQIQSTFLGKQITRNLAILNIQGNLSKQEVLNKLKAEQQCIDAIDIVLQASTSTSSPTSSSFSSLTSTSYSTFNNPKETPPIYHVIVYLKSNIMAEKLSDYFYFEKNMLTLYLKNTIIIQQNSVNKVNNESESSKLKNSTENINHNEIDDRNLSIRQIKRLLYDGDDLAATKTKSKNSPYHHQYATSDKKEWVQLPKCPQCLLRLQCQLSGIKQEVLRTITTQKDNQSDAQSHCQTCRIIKYKHTEKENNESTAKKGEQQGSINAHCDDCKQKSDIWICMICYRVGCGRYKNADAYKHYVSSGHNFTIDLESQGIWNYLADRFSHKLHDENALKRQNQNMEKIKFPEITDKNANSATIEQTKLQAAFWQYCSTFSEQMQRQRIFYENIRKDELKRFQDQQKQLDQAIKQLQTEKQKHTKNVKNAQKHYAKNQKKMERINAKIIEQRQILKQQDEYLSSSNDQQYLLKQIDEDTQICDKKKILSQIEKQIDSVLIELSQSATTEEQVM